jgi:CRISPR/Cas system-associated protein endoribonuclease Cas2
MFFPFRFVHMGICILSCTRICPPVSYNTHAFRKQQSISKFFNTILLHGQVFQKICIYKKCLKSDHAALASKHDHYIYAPLQGC